MSQARARKPLVEIERRLFLKEGREKHSGAAPANPEPARVEPPSTRRKHPKGASPAEGFFGFVFAALIMGLLLYDQVGGTHYVGFPTYELFRTILLFAIGIMLIVQAFQHNMIHGVLCLVFPPYLFMYGLLIADSGALRGFMVALVVFLGAEWYLFENGSFAQQAGFYWDAMVNEGNSLIEQAGAEHK